MLFLSLAGVLGLAAALYATDSTVIGNPLTRAEAKRIAASAGAPELEIVSIARKGTVSDVRFARPDDPVPLLPLEIGRCEPARCRQKLSRMLWIRDVQRGIAEHLDVTFHACGLPLLAIPVISLRWTEGASVSRGRDPSGRLLDLEAEVVADVINIGSDVEVFRNRVANCLRSAVATPQKEPGFGNLTDTILMRIALITIPDDFSVPEALPVLGWGPYQTLLGAPGLQYKQPVASSADGVEAGWLRAWADISIDTDLQNAVEPALLTWLRTEIPSENLGDYIRMHDEMRVAGPSPRRLCILFQVSDARGDAEAVIAVTHDLDTGATDDFEIILEPGDPANLDGPSWYVDGKEIRP